MVVPIVIAIVSAAVSFFSLYRNENTAKLSREHDKLLKESEQKYDEWKTRMADARERELDQARQAYEKRLAEWKVERDNELAAAKRADDLLMEQWRDEREQKREEEKAHRDYELEARKRLYFQCEPILFQLHQQCEVTIKRISHMPRREKQGRFRSKDEYLRAKDSMKA